MFTRDSVIISHNIKTPLTSISRAVGNILQLTYGQLIKSLFANNEQGFAYDPNDLTTMFQDAAGTIPVTAAGQPVGLMLDKSKGLALGVNIQSNGTGDSISGWNTFGAGLSLQNGTFRMNGAGAGTVVAAPNLPLVSGRLYAVSMSVKADVPTNMVSLNFRKKSEPGTSISIQNPVLSLDTTYKTITVFLSTNVPTADTALCFRFSGSEIINVDWIEIRELSGNHAYQTTSASRPILQRNATTGANYLEFDGTDDFLQTNNIDFTATDKVSLFAGVRKMPATTVNMLCELSSSSSAENQTNAFYLAVPETPSGTVFFRSRTTVLSGQIAKAESGSGMRNCVITAKSDIPNDLNTVSIDGVLGTPARVDLGIGKLGNYPLYIGRRGGATLPFNGHLYSLIGIGRLTTDSETAAVEKSIAKNAGVVI